MGKGYPGSSSSRGQSFISTAGEACLELGPELFLRRAQKTALIVLFKRQARQRRDVGKLEGAKAQGQD